jgi:hypothetical protein
MKNDPETTLTLTSQTFLLVPISLYKSVVLTQNDTIDVLLTTLKDLPPEESNFIPETVIKLLKKRHGKNFSNSIVRF